MGLSVQPDPASYVFGRVGYELPLADRLYFIGLIGGFLRFDGDNGGNAFTADAVLDYHWVSNFSFGLGAGYWSGNDGQVDLIADVGYRLSGGPTGSSSSLFFEARLPSDHLDDAYALGRFGVGVRFRF